VQGKVENYACTNIVRGVGQRRQMIKVHDVLSEKTFLCISIIYGYASEMVKRSERRRRCWGRH